jgi:anionic cell wall polymer biosynthesis LytR-Cps2A-Psr (LCP) family protein
MNRKFKNILKHLSIITGLFFLAITGILVFVFNIFSESTEEFSKKNSTATFSPFVRTGANTIVNRKQHELEKAKRMAGNKEFSVIRTSLDFNKDIPFTVDRKAGVVYKKQYNGRRINICITGVDSRIGSNFKHADANHVLSILIDKGEIEITSIPRDTYADAGMPDTTNQNIIAVLRPAKGRRAYLNRIAQIAELDTIHYFMEFGFSQAMGIIEWLGYDNSKQTLQVLRSRKVFGGGDWQRTYNQGKFMKQAMLKSFNNYGGIFGDLVLMGGLSLTETNLTSSTLNAILKKLKESDFGQSEDITLRVRPEFPYEYKNFDFDDKEIIAHMSAKVEQYSNSKPGTNQISTDTLVINELRKAIGKAVKADSTGQANLTINTLKTYFQQKAWLQITDKNTRHHYRETMKNLLMSAYNKKNDPANAEKVKKLIEQESNLFLNSKNKSKTSNETAQELMQ